MRTLPDPILGREISTLLPFFFFFFLVLQLLNYEKRVARPPTRPSGFVPHFLLRVVSDGLGTAFAYRRCYPGMGPPCDDQRRGRGERSVAPTPRRRGVSQRDGAWPTTLLINCAPLSHRAGFCTLAALFFILRPLASCALCALARAVNCPTIRHQIVLNWRGGITVSCVRQCLRSPASFFGSRLARTFCGTRLECVFFVA